MLLLITQTSQKIKDIPTPVGYSRIETDDFGTYLRNISLKSDNTVYLYDGRKKSNQQAQYAVLDVPVGNRDLQQCADAVMRLRGDYFFSRKMFDKIKFLAVSGKYIQYTSGENKITYNKFMDKIFSYCNSYSLEKQMNPQNIKNLKIGDVIIRGGFPGHVVIIVDIAINKKGQKAYMLAQSYMPAQDIHILKGEEGPWYYVKEGDYIINTPEYSFRSTEVKSW